MCGDAYNMTDVATRGAKRPEDVVLYSLDTLLQVSNIEPFIRIQLGDKDRTKRCSVARR